MASDTQTWSTRGLHYLDVMAELYLRYILCSPGREQGLLRRRK